jgi:hypothetical protein
VTGHQAIREPSHRCKTRKLVVTPEPDPASSSALVTEHPENRFRAKRNPSIGLNEMNTRAKRFDRNVFSKTFGNCLKWGDVHLSTDGFLPSPDPTDTKVTFAIVNEERLLSRRVAVA